MEKLLFDLKPHSCVVLAELLFNYSSNNIRYLLKRKLHSDLSLRRRFSQTNIWL